jgi:hypothetical protein
MASVPRQSDSPTIEDALRTRRRVLGAGLGALAAAAASMLGRATPTQAANGDAVRVGQTNTGTAPTTIKNSNSYAVIGDGYYGVYGKGENVGVLAQADDGIGVWGTDYGDTGVGVRGEGTRRGVTGSASQGWSGQVAVVDHSIPAGVGGVNPKGFGVVGVTGSDPDEPTEHVPGTAGVLGASGAGKVGVYGASGAQIPTTGPPNCGVYGWSDANSTPGYGVFGKMDGALGYGVLGTSDKGVGVRASTKGGVGLSAAVLPSGTGKALVAEGRVEFSTSGLTTIPPGASSVLINPGIPIPASARILCTLESYQAGLSVERTKKLPGHQGAPDQFYVYLNGAVTASRRSTKVAWFMIG